MTGVPQATAAPAPARSGGHGATLTLYPGRAEVTPPPPLALDRLLKGKAPEEIAALLPRLFNLCPMAQEQAARLALGLPPIDTRGEIARAHRARLGVMLPLAMGLAPRPVAPGLTRGLPPRDLIDAFAPLFQALSVFPRGAALTRPLPFPQGAETLTLAPFENSPAGRQSAHPQMQGIEAEEGRSPRWRLAGLILDLAAAEAGTLPQDQGAPAVVQAARGAYALQIGAKVIRRTPTDHLMAKGGVLEQSMATCPPALAPLLLALHDPCVAVTTREAQNA